MAADEGKTYTAGQVTRKLGMAPITLRTLINDHGDKIPTHGTAPRLRFPESALTVIQELREAYSKPRGRRPKAAAEADEAARPRRGRGAKRVVNRRAAEERAPSTGRRGKGKAEPGATGRAKAAKSATAAKTAKPGKPAKAQKASKAAKATEATPAKDASKKGAAKTSLLSLKGIERETKISYPTLMRYVRVHGDEIPSQMVGNQRRFPREAIAVFRDLRSRSRAGRKPASRVVETAPAPTPQAPAAAAPKQRRSQGKATAGSSTSGDLAATLAAIESRLSAIEAELRRPLSLAVVRG